jgi:hypothetical protein
MELISTNWPRGSNDPGQIGQPVDLVDSRSSIRIPRPQRRSLTGTDRVWVSASVAFGNSAAATSRSAPRPVGRISMSIRLVSRSCRSYTGGAAGAVRKLFIGFLRPTEAPGDERSGAAAARGAAGFGIWCIFYG